MRYSGAAAFLVLGALVSGRADAQNCSPPPPRDCTGSGAYCTMLMPFEPVTGLGYDNYPINGETSQNQYRSYTRRDLMMLVKHAAAVVECVAKTWTPGNRKPIGLGDMSEADGRTPGSAAGRPGHPRNTHEKGRDMDIAYYQTSSADNRLRSVCPDRTPQGKRAYRCTGAPTILDVRRTALFVGTLLTSPQVRIIGVDGRIEPLIQPALRKLCDERVVARVACDRAHLIASETTDTGKGWYKHHHHHLHVSMKRQLEPGIVPSASEGTGIDPSGPVSEKELMRLEQGAVPGHVAGTATVPKAKIRRRRR